MELLLFTLLLCICPGSPQIFDDPETLGKLNEIADEILQSTHDKHITLNGNKMTVRDLYNDASTASLQVSPSEKILWTFLNMENEPTIGQEPVTVGSFTARGEYIDRKFAYQHEFDISELPPDLLKDTPTAIANNLAISRAGQRPLFIVGDARSGKTCALRKIQSLLVQLLPKHWTIFLSSLSLTPLSTDPPQVETLRSIVEREVGAESATVFHDLLTINPKKIIFLLDSVDGLVFNPHKRSIIESVLNSGATVIMTGRPYALKPLEVNYLMNVVKIQEMTLMESANFLRAIWKHDMMVEVSNRPSSSTFNDHKARLDTYTDVFTHTLFKTNLPRQPVPLMVLAEAFRWQRSAFLQDITYTYPVGCLDYVFDPQKQLFDLPLALENVVINKKVLFDAIVSKYIGGNPNRLEFQYGITALANCFNNHELLVVTLDLLAPLEERLTAARATLARLQPAALFVDILDVHTIRFIHHEFESYFAAQAIFTLIDVVEPVVSRSIWTKILLSDYYSSIQLFIDGYVRANPQFAIPIVSQIKIPTQNRIVINLMNNGVQNLFINYFRYQIFPHWSTAQLRHYFLYNPQNFAAPNLVFGMQRSSKPHPNPDPFDAPAFSLITCTPVELLVERNMLQALQALRTSIWFSKSQVEYQQHYSRLLHRVLAKPLLNNALVKFLMENTVRLGPEILNELLFLCVNEAGNNCRWLAEYLVKQGAVPARTVVRGQSLLHAAVKWNNVHLLRFCIDDLHVPALDTLDHTGVSVFARALDANPSPFFTFPGWWEMMNYLIRTVKHLILPIHLRLTEDKELMAIPKAELNSPWTKMLTYSNSMTSLPVKRAEMDVDSSNHINNVARFTSFKTSWPLSSKTLALRRNLWISRVQQQYGTLTVSISEMLVYFRGVSALSAQHIKFYTSSLNLALNLEREHLSSESIQRLLGALCDNIFDHNDLMNLQATFEYLTKNQMLSQDHHPVLRPFLKKILDRLYSSRMSIQSENPGSEVLLLSDRLLQSNNDYCPVLLDPEIKIKLQKMAVLLEKAYLANPTTSTDTAILQCLSPRRSRRDVGPRFCMVSWTDVDAFNDAHPTSDRRIISRVRVNTDKFLQLIDELKRAEAAKADQLVELVRALRRQEPELLVGTSKILARDVIEHGGLDGYRKFQRTMAIVNDAWRGSARPGWRRLQFPSRTVFAAASIPILRGLHVTIATCLQHTDNPDRCWYASGALVMSGGLTALSVAAGKFVPWLVNHFTQTMLDVLPVSAPTVIRQYIGHMRYLGLKYGVKTFGYALGIIGIGFDLFNIVQLSQMIDACSQPDSGCRDRDKTEYIITLTFSCVAITVAGGLMMSGVGFVPGVLIGLALLVLEQVTLGLSAVYYYSRDYHTTWSENMRIFWHKIALQSVPSDIQALENRTDWTNLLQHQIEQQLEVSDARVVAYAVGLGVIVGSNVTAGYAFINMAHSDVKNTEGLSRVRANAQNWTTLLCSPRYDPNAPYRDWPTQSASSVYRCDNAFVVGHKNRWKNRNHQSYVFYNLEYVSRGTVIGSNSLNNLFSIYGSESNTTLDIVGGNGNITNTYVVHSESFTGSIKLPGGISRNILDFSTYDGILNFHWFPKYRSGHVQTKADKRSLLKLCAVEQSVNVAVIGRSGEMDVFACGYSELQDADVGATSIVVNGGGGRTFYNMDTITDCEKSVIHPFTQVLGSNSSLLYTVYVPLAPLTTEDFIGKAFINPDQSKFIVTFINSPIFVSTLFVRYKPKTNTLVWKVAYTNTQVLYLHIKPYRSVNLTRQKGEDSVDSVSVNCVFIDSYYGTTVYPVIELPSNSTLASVDVTKFNIFGNIDSIQLSNVLKVYHSTQIQNSLNFSIVTKLTHAETGQSFTFGSEANDRFYVDGNSTFFYGGNGQDIYALSRNSSRLVWIENEASDDALDTLIIPSPMCDESLRAVGGSEDSECCYGSEDDVTLVCTIENSTFPVAIKVVLRSYLLDQQHRHLQIYWRNATYVLLPLEWSSHHQGLLLGLFFDLTGWQSTMLTLTSSDTCLVLGVADSANPVIAYSSGERDLVLATKFFSRDVSSFALLQDFFADNTSDAVINPEWEKFMVFIVQGSPTNLTSTLNASDILNLYFETAVDDNSTEFIKEYLVGLSPTANENQTIVIDHNNSLSRLGDQIGVLALIGVPSGPLQATWADNGTSLSLDNRNTHVVVKNWCYTVHHRLQRIEWYRNFYSRPSVIRYLDHLECPRKESSSKITIDRVNATLYAMYKLVIDSERNDNDDAQLSRCVGSIFAENFVGKFFFRLFGFESLNDQIYFFYNTCHVLMSESKLKELSYENCQKTIKDFSEASGGGDRESLNMIQKQFNRLGDECWKSFKNGLQNITSGDRHMINILPECAHL